jgi:DNA-binding MarR family transcriptional regulator
MTVPAATAGAPLHSDAANRLLARLVEHSHKDPDDTGTIYEGFLNELGVELELSPTRVSRALKALCDANRVEVVQRGHGRSPTRLRVLSTAPLSIPLARPTRPALADRLLEHLATLSSDGVVERPLVDVAKELDVGAPSVSRALGHLVEEGLARVDQVGTRGRPTRIALVPSPAAVLEAGTDADVAPDEIVALREENEQLRREVARLRRTLGARTGPRGR